jgi:hypothetical protein
MIQVGMEILKFDRLMWLDETSTNLGSSDTMYSYNVPGEERKRMATSSQPKECVKYITIKRNLVDLLILLALLTYF